MYSLVSYCCYRCFPLGTVVNNRTLSEKRERKRVKRVETAKPNGVIWTHLCQHHRDHQAHTHSHTHTDRYASSHTQTQMFFTWCVWRVGTIICGFQFVFTIRFRPLHTVAHRDTNTHKLNVCLYVTGRFLATTCKRVYVHLRVHYIPCVIGKCNSVHFFRTSFCLRT